MKSPKPILKDTFPVSPALLSPELAMFLFAFKVGGHSVCMAPSSRALPCSPILEKPFTSLKTDNLNLNYISTIAITDEKRIHNYCPNL